VEVVQNGAVVATATTDANGNYTVPSLSVTGGIYVRALSDASSPYAAAVVDNTSATFALRSADFVFSAGNAWQVNLLASSADVGPVFNIMDDLIISQDVDYSLAGKYANKITGVWYSGSTVGTYYESYSGNIYILGDLTPSLGSDAYDDGVILHEMGHYTASNYSRDNSPGGQHSFSKHYDLTLTWSEGWATFYSCMARSLRPITGSNYPQWYVDSPGWPNMSNYSSLSVDIDTPASPVIPSASSRATGSDNELAISNILWHIFAAANPATPTASPHLGLGAADIWSVFSTYLTSMPSTVVATLERFYDGWVANASHPSGQLNLILQDRGISYAADQYEPDNNIAQARQIAVGTTQNHSFSPAGDKDYFRVSVTNGTQYTFTTSNLTLVGADTMLTLLDSDGTTILAQNDDISSANKASQIVWTANGTKNVYVIAEAYRPYTTADVILYPTLATTGYANNPAVVQYFTYTFGVTSP
jgi:hypothetical protein